MKICLYGAASDLIDKKYLIEVEKLFEKFAKDGHALVFGGGREGEMGAAARGMYAGGGEIVSVFPKFFIEENLEPQFEHLTEQILVDTLKERKAKMEELADCFLVVPGGIGTFDEFFETLTLKQLGRHNKEIVLFNIDGFYDPIIEMMEKAKEEGFLRRNSWDMYKVFDNAEEIREYLNNSGK